MRSKQCTPSDSLEWCVDPMKCFLNCVIIRCLFLYNKLKNEDEHSCFYMCSVPDITFNSLTIKFQWLLTLDMIGTHFFRSTEWKQKSLQFWGANCNNSWSKKSQRIQMLEGNFIAFANDSIMQVFDMFACMLVHTSFVAKKNVQMPYTRKLPTRQHILHYSLNWFSGCHASPKYTSSLYE